MRWISSKPLKDSGFTLLEVMISMVLMAMAVLGMAFLQSRQNRDQGAIQHQMRLRQVGQEIIAKISSNPANFPIINGPGNVPMTYVACFSDDGTAINRVGPTAGPGFAGLLLPVATDPAIALVAGGNGNVQVCPLNQGGVEVHVYRVGDTVNGVARTADQVTDIYRVSVIVLAATINPRSFQISSEGMHSWIGL